MISGKEVHVLDHNAAYFNVSTEMLMEHAGKQIADGLKSRCTLSKNTHILILCGPGNNGGDGFVAARYLAEYATVTVFCVEQNSKTPLAQTNLNKLKTIPITIYTEINKINDLLKENDIIIDALLGIGLSGNLREPYKTIVTKINAQKNKTIVSVDVPTGLGTTLAVVPDQTITFHDVKEGMTQQNSGDLYVVDIGIPKQAIHYVGPGELIQFYPRFKKTSHKGDNGHVLIIGGGPYLGAPALAGLAALRMGADIVTIATPSSCRQSIASFSPDLIVHPLSHPNHLHSDDLSILEPLIEKSNSVVIGPGIGGEKETQQTVQQLITIFCNKQKPLVIDADAIQAIGEKHELLTSSHIVITPHGGEFTKLTGKILPQNLEEKKDMVQEIAKYLDVTLFVKGPVDIISDGTFTKQNIVHHEAMTVGGTGDVLSGIIGSLLSKQVSPYDAARVGAFVNGSAGILAFEQYSYGMLASDIITSIPKVLKQYL